MGQKLNWTATLGLTTALLAASLPMQPVVAERHHPLHNGLTHNWNR